MTLLVEAMVYISTNNSREIYMTVLDPYGKMNNDVTWTPGASGHSIVGGGYAEDTGAGPMAIWSLSTILVSPLMMRIRSILLLELI